ncbi:GMP reductase [Gulosibacter molinativorax]|uniref:GMP reductase n=1 Tax=Gulosibacter molinativorax TaxID=256821 RepID=A0ABT7C432_9MICO|nr:GuaB1 family IMP dehydrogenase-related protein [Gulosibacter molinativorax]MDJ1369913.1 GuaB1 family IMP dehydrogenase-related protein [Gulosibacter molinativorax]QUY61882.1 Inosine-5'-monophosphate dehydrogenase [Gulosibacter molinativorax]
MQFYGQQPQHDLTYSDVFLIPSRSEVGSRLGVDLATNDETGMQIPLVASNMNSVTGPRMASAMARRGGLAVLPQDLDEADLVAGLAWVKSQHPIWTAPFAFDGSATVAEVLSRVPAVKGQTIAVQEAGETRLILEAFRLERIPEDAHLADLGHLAAPMMAAEELRDARIAFDRLEEVPEKFVAVEQDGELVGALSRRDALRSTLYRPNLDDQGRLRVAAALGINGDIVSRAKVLQEAGADVLVLDTAHGHQGSMLKAITAVREAELGLPIVAGNVVSSAGTRDLVNAGADIVKVGVGPGAMCTTRMMTAVGRPQFSAVLECAETARTHRAGVWADGGVRYPRDVALALAAGGSAVMIGSWFAGTCEAPGVAKTDESGRLYKESFGMASTRAVTERFGKLDAYERARKMLFAEGISNSTILMDPNLPSVDDLIDIITTGVRSSCTYAGAGNLAEFAERAKVGIQSAAGYEEGKPLPVSW